MRIGVASTLMKEYTADQRGFFGLLAQMLKSSLSDQTELVFRGFIKKTLAEIRLGLGDYDYSIEAPERGPVRVSRKHMVRGIALKSEEIPMEQCLAEIDAALQTQAVAVARARKALADTLGLS